MLLELDGWPEAAAASPDWTQHSVCCQGQLPRLGEGTGLLVAWDCWQQQGALTGLPLQVELGGCEAAEADRAGCELFRYCWELA